MMPKRSCNDPEHNAQRAREAELIADMRHGTPCLEGCAVADVRAATERMRDHHDDRVYRAALSIDNALDTYTR